jgi:hypothetical protein
MFNFMIGESGCLPTSKKGTVMRKPLLVLMMLVTACSQSTSKQVDLSLESSVISDDGIYPAPPPPVLPRAGQTFVDPVFGTTILRVTDVRDGPNNQVPYSYWPTFNRDNTRIMIGNTSGEGFLYDFDPINFRIANKRPLWTTLPDGGLPIVEDAIWSGINRNIIYGHAGSRLWKYNVATRSYTLLHDFAPQVPNLWQMSRSLDDNVFCFTWQDAQYTYKGWVCWRRDTNQVWRRQQAKIDELKVDKTGRYVHVSLITSGAGVVEGQVIDLQTNSIVNLRDNQPDFNPGHADMGRNMIVGVENWENRLLGRRLSTPRSFWVVWDFANDWSQDYHVSLLEQRDRWTLISSYIPDGISPGSGPFHNEIFAVRTNGSQQVRRLAHHHSVVREYSDSPRANISRDGRFVAFTSNWGGTAQNDVFIVRVPEGALD